MKHKVILIAILLVGFAVTSNNVLATEPSNGPAEKPLVVFLISEDPDNYEATKTIPPFAKMLEDRYNLRCKVIQGEGEPGKFYFPELESIAKADALVIFFRRRALSEKQLGMIRDYLNADKPLVGIRTANHAFSVRDKTTVAPGHEMWWDFVPEVLGCGNHGYGPVKPGIDVVIQSEAVDHPALAGLKTSSWHSAGNLYFVKPIDEKATVLLTGSVEGKTEPIAWTRLYRKSRIFYTSLGHPSDFNQPQFRTLLVNGLHWAMKKELAAK